MAAEVKARLRAIAGAAVIFLATAIAYSPTYRAGFIWDDPEHVLNNPTLRDASGLRQIWTDRHSLPQWYPLVHTTFWMEYRIWGDRPLGYHAVNVLLHACNAVLVWQLLRLLAVPGGFVAGLFFALHPVHVESVAWVTERKNVLSTLFYLLAMMVYLRAFALREFDAKAWWGAFVLFLAALLSKTVTCSLPAAILLIIWWKRGRLRWREVIPLMPFFAAGALLALNTAHLERVRVGAFGAEWDYADSTFGEFLSRTIIAGKAIWFYLYKLVWPRHLAFVYERWQINWHDAAQYVYPAAAIAVLITLFALRRRIGRGPLVVALLFAGTLVPALGFVNVFPHRYSFVADHFQYLASIALIAAAAALLARTLNQTNSVVIGLVISTVLGLLTWHQSKNYRDAETLWKDTVTKSPHSWMAWTNYGNALAAQERYDEAIEKFETALDLAPEIYDVQYNAGVARARQEKFEEAEKHFRRAVELMPTFVPAWESLGDLYANRLNQPDRAIEAYERATEIAPQLPSPQVKLEQSRRRLREQQRDQ